MTGEPRMKPWTPRFEPGQVVEAAALNQLTSMVAEMSHFRARQFHGHGIVYGLSAELIPGDKEWKLSPGAALDPLGRLVVVSEEQRIPVCEPLVEPDDEEPAHPYVEDPDLGRDNLTPVVFFRSQAVADPRGGVQRLEASFEIRWVRGRVATKPPAVYALQPLEPLADLRAADGNRFLASFSALKQKVHEEMSRDQEEPFRNSARRRLNALTLSQGLIYGRPSARDVLTVAALNDVVYTLWQRARSQQYLDLRGFELEEDPERRNRPKEGPEHGVPLGWLYRDAQGTWRWDGRWRSGFALGLSRLELLGYAPRAVRAVGADRVHYLLAGLEHLRPFLPADRDARERRAERPSAWILSPLEYERGTQAWMRHLRLDRPQRIATLWPLDPLRGCSVAPVASEPRLREDADAAAGDSRPPTGRPAPSLLDPLNDPFTFSEYSEVDRVDPRRNGLVGLAELVGFPLGRVWGALARQEGPNGARLKLSRQPVSIADDAACEGLEFVLVASFDEPLTLVTEADSDAVLGFARAASSAARARAAGRPEVVERVSFLRWLFSF